MSFMVKFGLVMMLFGLWYASMPSQTDYVGLFLAVGGTLLFLGWRERG